MAETFKAGDRVYVVGGSIEYGEFGIWAGTVGDAGVTACWVRRDGFETKGVWTTDSMFRDRDAALYYATGRVNEYLRRLEAQRDSALMQLGKASRDCPATLDVPVTA